MPVLQVPAGEEGGPIGIPNILMEEEKEEDEEEKKKDDGDEVEMEEKRRDEEDMQESLVVEDGIIVKFTLVLFATCVLPLQFLLQESFQPEVVKHPLWRDTKKPNNINYVVPPEAPDHPPDRGRIIEQ